MGELHALARPGTGRPGPTGRQSPPTWAPGPRPLIAGLFAEYVAHPLVVPYAVFLALLLVAAIAVVLVPETGRPGPAQPRYRPQRVSVPSQGRPLYYTVAVASFRGVLHPRAVHSVAPGFIAERCTIRSPLLAGTVTSWSSGPGPPPRSPPPG